MNREIRFPTQGGRIFFLKIFRKIPGNLAEICRKRGQKSPIFAHGRCGGSVFPLRRIWKTDYKGLYWAFWACLWRILGSGNAGIAPATKNGCTGFLGLLGGCRKKSPLRLGSGAGCGCCCGGLGGSGLAFPAGGGAGISPAGSRRRGSLGAVAADHKKKTPER